MRAVTQRADGILTYNPSHKAVLLIPMSPNHRTAFFVWLLLQRAYKRSLDDTENLTPDVILTTWQSHSYGVESRFSLARLVSSKDHEGFVAMI